MTLNTKIEWAHHTFNTHWGCDEISDGCKNCYARNLGRRFGVNWGADKPRRLFPEDHWDELGKLDKRAAKRGEIHRVFINSMGDTFDKAVPDAVRARLWQEIPKHQHLIFLLLTKRIGNVPRMVPADWMRNGFPPNVWLGSSIVNRAEMLRDASKLKAVPAVVHFWSYEPALEDLGVIPAELMPSWCIAGGESGPKARPSHPDWYRSLRDQSAAAGVPFLFKQWGEWGPLHSAFGKPAYRPPLRGDTPMLVDLSDRNGGLARYGKKAAGRLLDGVTHDEFPRVI